jgi:preprotein translocase subunit SecE
MAVQKIQETRTFIEESWAELKKVTWPDYEQLKNATIVVLAFLVLISAVIWLMDVVVRNVLELIMGVFGA